MSVSVNSNRYVCTVVKTGISDFAMFSGTFVHYLLRNTQGQLYVKRGGDASELVQFPSQSGKLPRTFVSDQMSLAESASDSPVVSVMGYNPYQLYKSEFNCVYYSYLDAGIWKTVGLEACIQGVFPSFAIVVVTSAGNKFFVMQIGDNVTVYSIGASSITKKSQLDGFTVIDAMAVGEDIALLLAKKNTLYPSQKVYEAALGSAVIYYKNSPVVFLCTSSSGYASFSPFCQARSVFPLFCFPDDIVDNSSFFFHESRFYVVSLGYNPSLGSFVPIASVGESGDVWRYFGSVTPFSSITGILNPQICVDSSHVVYVAGKKNGQVYLSYYNRASNNWHSYDKASYLTFEKALVSSSSSSFSCSSSSSSSSE